MYQARVEAVSGTKVFADGKWLTCIGNKIVRVGEYIWTDGRVVYGYHQEAQQPLVITAPEDLGIPIAFYNGEIYTFKKNKLEALGTLNTAKRFESMINDKKGNVYFDSYDCVLAENIDSDGNLFSLIATAMREYYGTISIKVLKNNECMQTIDLEPFRDATLAATPTSGESYHVYSQIKNKRYIDIWWGFIENENDWAFLFLTSAGEGITYDFIYDLYDPYKNYGHMTLEFFRLHYVTPNQNVILSEMTSIDLPHFDGWSKFADGNDYFNAYRVGSSSWKHDDKEILNIKFPLQDNFYYKVSKTKHNDYFITSYENPPEDLNHFNSIDVTVYTPNDDELFTIPCSFEAKLRLREINSSSYLFAVQSSLYHKENMENGLYLYRDGEFQLLVKGSIINQRLRPMKKYKNWQNRIQIIS